MSSTARGAGGEGDGRCGRRRLRLALALLTSGLGAGCHANRAPEPPRGAIVIVVDALRASRLGCYGSERPASPNIDRVAGDGVRFANAVTAAPWTLPALGSLWTSLYPSVHGATRSSNEIQMMKNPSGFHPVRVLAESRTTLAEVLQANGFATAAFVDGAYTGRVFGMAQGFTEFVDDEVLGIRLNTDALLEWLDGVGSKRFFAWVHAVEVHSPYAPRGLPAAVRARSDSYAQRYRTALPEEQARFLSVNFDPGYSGPIDGSLASLGRLRGRGQPPEADARHLIALYDRGIAYSDYWIGRLIDGLKQRGLYDQTVVIITADHGEELFDHGSIEHGMTFYDEVMRVPLIIRLPGGPRGRVVDEQVGLIDLMPTLLGLFALPHGLPLQGVSLLPLLTQGGSLPDRLLFAEAAMWPPLKALRTNAFKYIRSDKSRQELYDLRGDPGERENLCGARPEQCAELAQAMQNWRGEMKAARQRLQLPPPRDAVIDPQSAESLRALGYE